ncbi:hypothetical protein BT96DRAFT_752099, partial [Gymnopus androsaceus JB14]
CQASNIESLLNSEAEKSMLDASTDQDIFDAVMHARAAKENGVIAGGDDDKDDDAAITKHPSCREALQAVTIMQKYVNGIDKLYARKLESILATFGQSTHLQESHSMVNSLITDFFSC